jgi:hypothetical protein
MSLLPAENFLLVLGQRGDVLEGTGLVLNLSNEGAPLEGVAVLLETLLLKEKVDISEQLLLRETDEGVVEQSANCAGTVIVVVDAVVDAVVEVVVEAALVGYSRGRAAIVGETTPAAAAAAIANEVARVVVCDIRVRCLVVNPWGRHSGGGRSVGKKGVWV